MSGNYEGNLIDCESGFVHQTDQQLISNLSPIEHPLSQRQRGATVEHVAPSPFRGLAPLSVRNWLLAGGRFKLDGQSGTQTVHIPGWQTATAEAGEAGLVTLDGKFI